MDVRVKKRHRRNMINVDPDGDKIVPAERGDLPDIACIFALEPSATGKTPDTTDRRS